MGDRAARLAMLRLMPLLIGMNVIAYLDRLNITFAETQLSRDLALSASQFGLAAGIFFAGYLLFEIPSNLVLARVGARRWFARIMLTWGVLAAACALAWDATSLIVLRFLLGVAEAGFVPGVIFFIACWFPEPYRGRATAWFLSGIAISVLVGGPLSGAMLSMDGLLGLQGWQWLFALQGLPAVLVGLYVLRALPDRPADAPWLDAAQKAWFERRLAEDAARVEHASPPTLKRAFGDRRVLLLGAIFFTLNVAGYGVIFWMADIVERIGGLSELEVGLIATIPFGCAAVGLFALGRAADRRVGDARRRVVIVGMVLAAAGAAGTAVLPPAIGIAALAVGAFGMLGTIPAFWTLPAQFLTGRVAAGGIALITSFGVFGGLIGPVLVGGLKDATGELDAGLLAVSAIVLVGALLATLLRLDRPVREERAAAPPTEPVSVTS